VICSLILLLCLIERIFLLIC